MGKRQICIILICFLSVIRLSAQQAKISGTVTDFDNSPIDFVSVSMQGSTMGVFTNGQGKYQISVSAGDSVTIVFSRIGYQKTERKIPKVTGNMNLNIIMHETVLEEVIVVGEKAQTSTMGKIELGRTNLQADPTGGSIESILALGPGVSSTNEMSSQYSVRGGNYDENIVYVNGIEIYRPLLIRSGQQEGLSFINPDMTKEVKFSTGGFESSYGDRMSSALDITYKRPQAFEASAAVGLMGANAYVGTSSKRFTQITGFRYKTNRALLGTLDTHAEYDPKFVDGQTYMTLGVSAKWEISFLGNISSNVFQFTPQSRRTQFGSVGSAKDFTVYFDGWENDRFLTYFGALSAKGKLSDNLEIEFMGSAYSSREYERYDISGEYKLTDLNLSSDGAEGDNGSMLAVGSYLEHARNSLDIDVTNFRHIGSLKVDKHRLQWGVVLQRERIEDQIKEWNMRDSAGYSLPYLGDVVSVYSSLRGNNRITSNRYSGFLQDTYRFMSGDNMIYINAGVRASHWTFNNETIISPRGSIALIPDSKQDVTLRFATGIYYQAPFYREYQQIITTGQTSVIELNKDIRSQKSIHFVLGGDYKFKSMSRPFKFTSEVYYKKLSDLVPYTVDNVKIRYAGENLGTGYTMGWDMKLFGEFVKGSDSWISFSLMKTQQTVNGIQTPLPTDQRYNISLFFQDYFPGMERLTMNLRGHLSQGLPQAAPNSQFFEKGYFRTPAYRRLDIGFAWQALGEDFDIRNNSSFWRSFKNIWVGVDVFNLFDISNTNSYYWITNVFNQQFAVPNYLTGRQLNVKIVADF